MNNALGKGEFNNSVINDFIKFDRIYWISVTITLIVSYAFMLTNPTVSLEDSFFQYYFFDGRLVQMGRWGSFPLRRVLNTYMFLPFWRPFIALVFMTAGFTLFSGVLKKYSNGKFNDIACAIFTCVGISFPIIPELFVLMKSTVDFGMMIFFTALSLVFSLKWVIDKARIMYGVFGAVLFGYAFAFVEFALIFWSIAAFSVLMVSFITSKSEGRSKISKDIFIFIKLIAIVIAGLIFWRLMSFVIQRLTGISGINYFGWHVRHDTSSPAQFVLSVLRYVIELPQNIILTDDIVMDILIVLATLILLVIGIVFSIVRKRLAIFLAALVSVTAAYGMFFLTGAFVMSIRLLMGFSVLFAASASILYAFVPKKYKLKSIILIACIYLMFFQTREINHLFYIEYLRYQHDVFVMQTVIRDLEGRERDKPVLFVGLAPRNLPVSTRFQHDPIVRLSALNFGRVEIFEIDPMRAYGFFEMHGFPIDPHPDLIGVDFDSIPTYLHGVDFDLIVTQIKGMPNWPQSGYIREFEDYIIVKLGPSFFDRQQID